METCEEDGQMDKSGGMRKKRMYNVNIKLSKN